MTALDRLEEVKRDVNAPAVIFEKLTDAEHPRTLPEIAKEWQLPRGKFVEWFVTAHRATYDSALKVLTDGMVFESLKIADDAGEDRDAIAKAKLRIDTKLRTAAKWDRERYGEREQSQAVVNISLVDVAKEIRELEQRLGIAIAQPSAALPVPAVIDVDPV